MVLPLIECVYLGISNSRGNLSLNPILNCAKMYDILETIFPFCLSFLNVKTLTFSTDDCFAPLFSRNIFKKKNLLPTTKQENGRGMHLGNAELLLPGLLNQAALLWTKIS